MSKITLKKFTGKSKTTGKDFQAYELRAGLFSTLIFPRSRVESDYLDRYLKDDAHADFQGDDLDVLFDKSDD